jgi:pilus assembly protein CpaF
MQCRSANLEGNGEISLRRLVKESLRMRPDRIIVGEVREAEALDLLIALNSGIPGLATIHANSAREAVIKASTLPLLAGENVTASFVNPTVASALDLVVHLRRERNGARVVGEIAGVSGRVENGHIESASIFQRTGDGLVRGSGLPPKEELFERLGIDLSFLLGQEAQWAS